MLRKEVLCFDDKWNPIKIQGIKWKVYICFISTMNIKQCMRKGCQLYIIEAISNEKGPSLNQYPMLLEFSDVIPKELLGLPPKRELDFTIEIKPGSNPTLKKLYRIMAP